MKLILNLFFWIILVLLALVVVNDELKYIKLNLNDITKILLLMLLLVVFYKKRQIESFVPFFKLNDNIGRPFGHDNINLYTDEFNPTNFFHNSERNNECPGQNPSCNTPFVDPVVNFPNSISEGKIKIDEKMNNPSVDGTPNSPKSRFMFAYNQCKPECCPGTYSCNGGCVCTNKNQVDYLNKRGSM